jgi:hypothetical protein
VTSKPSTSVAAPRLFVSAPRCPHCHYTAGVFRDEGKTSVRCLSCYQDAPHDAWVPNLMRDSPRDVLSSTSARSSTH